MTQPADTTNFTFLSEYVDNCFASDGGANRFNVVLDEQLDTVLAELREGIWLQQG